MKNDNAKSIVVLGSICLVVAILLSVVNHITAPIIEEAAGAAASESLKVVLPDATGFEEVELPEGTAETVTGIHKDQGGSGYAVTLATSSSYSQSPMTFTVGFGTDGKIVAIEMTNYAETKDFGDYPQSYVGADSALGGIELAAGVTYSSTAFKAAVEDAFAALIAIGGISEGVKSEEQIISELMADKFPGAVDNSGKFRATEMKVDAENVISAFSADNGVGFALTVDYNGEKLVCIISTSGSVAFYDLEANAVDTVDSAFVENIVSAIGVSAKAENDLKYAQATLVDGETLEKVDLAAQFGVVSNAFVITSPTRSSNAYVFVCRPFGYKDPMTMTFVIENGSVTSYRNTGDFIQFGEYYSVPGLNENEYMQNMAGKTEADITDELLVTGATISTAAVKLAAEDAFEAYKELTEIKNEEVAAQ
ncbi:MAG: FMN-binding protein [Clostridia bacterium]|nr:FMN-binding protein [Clostridia bacterium]